MRYFECFFGRSGWWWNSKTLVCCSWGGVRFPSVLKWRDFGQDAEIGCRCGTVPLLVQCWSGNLSKGAFLTQSAGINEISLYPQLKLILYHEETAHTLISSEKSIRSSQSEEMILKCFHHALNAILFQHYWCLIIEHHYRVTYSNYCCRILNVTYWQSNKRSEG